MLQRILCILLLIPSFPLAQEIRIVPQTLSVSNDSLHIRLDMDLNEVHAGSSTAILFTPLIQGRKEQLQKLPSVVISGKRRARQDRRERYLSLGKERMELYLLIREGRHTPSKTISYHMVIPYAGWMQHAALLLKQERRECCGNELLAVDTLQYDLNLAAVAVVSPSSPVKTKIEKPQPVVADTAVITTVAAVTVPVVPATPARKIHDTSSLVLYFDYPVGKDDIHPDLKNNRYEIDKIDRLFAPLMREQFVSVRSIRICGYCSPDGNYGDNERLAEARSRFFAIYLRGVYGIPRGLIDVSSVAEDWEGLTDLLMKEDPPYRSAALQVITRYGVFNGREKHLMDLQGGWPYKDMLRYFFPRLRRIEVIVRHEDDKTEDE